ncbi:ketoacyl-synt-domain-containing protein [Peniophora sp. CONT]|nr:ketoacyl-synt-domain-containing protein [Peniophora sp. CONT]
MSDYIEIPIFASQGTGPTITQQAAEKALTCAKSPGGSLLLTSCFETFHTELSSLDTGELAYMDIDLSDFDHPEALLFLPHPRYHYHRVISWTRFFVLQSLTYLATRSDPSTSAFRTAHTPGAMILGFSSGILPACVAGTSSSTIEYITGAIAALRLSIWIGVRTQALRRSALEEAGMAKDDTRPWALVFVGWSRENALTHVAAYNTQFANESPLLITTVLDDSCLTISGRCDILAAFAAQVPPEITVHETSLYSLYHAPVANEDVKRRVLDDIVRRDIHFPNFTSLKTPIACTATGQLLSSSHPPGVSLVEHIVDLILTQPVNWDKVVRTLVDETRGVRLHLLNVGPGNGATKRIARFLPQGSVIMTDASAVVDYPAPSSAFQESIAIVGMAVNMPGAPDVSSLWKILEQGISTITEIPNHRFKVSDYDESRAGKTKRCMKARTGNFISDADGFDNTFFKISPREARSMDPQARVLLHTAYEALEDAGYVPNATPSFDPETFGCYIGVATGDYAQNLRNDIDVYYSTGTLRAFLSGRISYIFKLGGPSVVSDTACSSSFVSIYQACRALSARDCNAALAGGVNIITSPDVFIGLDRAHFLSPTGQCRAFDASADGYSRSEGCGLFVLKRLSDALAENDNILGVIRGIEVNQSGLAHSITHPHAPTQARLFKQLLERSNVEAGRVSVVEAHGTGTQAGDPVELESIRAVFCARRTADNPLHVTSVKANIGHLEAASGAAGLAKLLLMLKHRAIPRMISLRNLNPRIKNLEGDHTVIDRTQVPWRPAYGDKTRMVMLNNFGAAGSNGALLLEEHVARPVDVTKTASSLVFGISAKSADALDRLRHAYINWLQHPDYQDLALVDVAYTATARRIVYDHRIAVSASSREELVGKLGAASISSNENVPGKVAFVFSGQGGQYRGMGDVLYHSSAVFREIVDECHSYLVKSGFPGVLQVICPEDPFGTLAQEEEFEINQPAIFVLEYALARMWMSWGVEPVVVVGHSLGEYAAHVVAGVLALKDALTLLANRARFMVTQCAVDSTSMLAVNLNQTELDRILASSSSFAGVSIACYNGPSDLVVSGTLGALQSLKVHVDEKVRVKTLLLSVPFGYHSNAMDPILADLVAVGRRITMNPPTIAVVSNVLGELVRPGTEGIFTPEYYARHCSEPVQFVSGLTSLCKSSGYADISVWIEIGPHSATLPMLNSHPLVRKDAALLPSLKRNQDAWATLTSTLARLYLTSTCMRWRDVFSHTDARCTHLPAYPWSKSKFWVAFEEDDAPAGALPQGAESINVNLVNDFAMLYRWVQTPIVGNDPTAVFETPISYLARAISGHSVGGVPLCPASVYHELALAGVEVVSKRLGLSLDGLFVVLSDIEFTKPLVYRADVQRAVYTSITLRSDGSGSWRVSSCVNKDGLEDNHCSGTFKRKAVVEASSKFARAAPLVSRQIAAIEASMDAEVFSTRTAYEVIFSRVVEYGKEYHTMRSLRLARDGMEGYAVVQLPKDRDPGNFVVHPVLIDTLLHVAGFAANLQCDIADAFICHKVEKVDIPPALVDSEAPYGVFFRNAWLPEERLVLAEAYAIELGGQRRIVAHVKGMHFRRLRLAGFKRSLAADPGAGDAGLSRQRPSPAEQQTGRSTLHAPSTVRPAPNVTVVVKQIIAQTCDATSVDVDADLESYGVDSLMSIEILHKLKLAFPDIALDAAALSACKTVVQIVDQVALGRPLEHHIAAPPSPDSETTKVETEGNSASANVKDVLAAALGIPVSGLADDVSLEALGLDSLMMIEVKAELQDVLGFLLPAKMLESAKTVKDVLDMVTLRNVTSNQFQPATITPPRTPSVHDALVPVLVTPKMRVRLTKALRLDDIPLSLQAGAGTPLFLVHDGSGIVDYLTRVEPLGRPLWGLNNPRFLDDQPWASLEAMASAYVSHILEAVGSSDPKLILGGWSFGGVVAFEAARQLRARGMPVRGVLLIDSPPPRTHVPLNDALIASVSASTGRPSSSDLAPLVARQFTLNSRLLGAYGAGVSKGPFLEQVVLLRSSDGLRLADDRVLVPRWLADRRDTRVCVQGWEELLGHKITVLPIPGNHFEAFSPQNVGQVSRAIAEGAGLLDRS